MNMKDVVMARLKIFALLLAVLILVYFYGGEHIQRFKMVLLAVMVGIVAALLYSMWAWNRKGLRGLKDD